MGPSLTRGWLDGAQSIAIVDEAAVSLVRERVRAEGKQAGLATDATESLVTAASELGHNQLRHAAGGSIAVRTIRRTGVAGVEVIAADSGDGIANPTRALEGTGSATPGLGIGLSGAYRLADEVDFDVRSGEGTCVRARKFAEALPRTEVAILGRPIPGETASGDQAIACWLEDALVLAVVDGLGHGVLAREASDAAISVVRGHAHLPPSELLARCEVPLQATRGAVISIARLDLRTRDLTYAGIGNVAAQVRGPRSLRRFANSNGVVGTRQTIRKPRDESVPFAQRHVLLLFSDGFSSRCEIADDADLLRQPPLVIAHQLEAQFARDTDDALVAVVR